MEAERSRLRAELRARRRGLPEEARVRAALSLANALLVSEPFRRARRIAAFVAADGEIDLGPFMSAARSRGRELFLPVVDPREGRLRFRRTEAGQFLHPNRYGIPEPVEGLWCAPRYLDLVLLPLVGFDLEGNRLGMGAGYYDRTFSYLARRKTWRKPRLVGAAFDLQQIHGLAPGPWDVPLDAVATETGVHECAIG